MVVNGILFGVMTPVTPFYLMLAKALLKEYTTNQETTLAMLGKISHLQ